MDKLWERIEALQDQTLRTLARGHEFVIVYVNRDQPTAIRVIPKNSSSATPRPILRRNIERAYSLRQNGQLRRTADFRRHDIKTKNSSYILAILNAIEVRQ